MRLNRTSKKANKELILYNIAKIQNYGKLLKECITNTIKNVVETVKFFCFINYNIC